MLTIRFNADKARFLSGLDSKLEQKIMNSCLRWVDKSVEQANRFTPFPRDPVRYCYDRKRKEFPTGLVPRVSAFLKDWDISHQLEMTYELVDALEVPTPDWAWQHQKELVENVMQYRRCIIRSPTASGKTTSIALLVEKFKELNTLIIAPQNNIVDNIAQDLREKLNLEPGVIGGGKFSWKKITVSTDRSIYLKSKNQLKKQLKEVDVLIFDECHHYSNMTGQTISAACPNTSYRCGLSATTEVENGSGLVLEGVIGPTTLVIPDTLMVDLGIIHKPEILFIPVQAPSVSDLPIIPETGKPDRLEVYKRALVHNEERNQIIIDLIKYFKLARAGSGCSALVLIDLKDHGHLLQKMFKEQGLDVPFIWGETKNKIREETIKSFKEGHLDALIASRILNEGEDVPRLEMVINAGGGSGKRGIIQKSGRALRKDKSERKKRAIIVDFYDEESYYLRANSAKRINNINDRHPDCVRKVTVEDVLNVINNSKREA